jgi:hypothetical protein
MDVFYALCILAFLSAFANHHFKLITHEYPLDRNEPGMLVITQTLVDGSNPFARETQPAHMSCYPALYNALVAPVTRVTGNSLAVHRAMAGAFILACCALVYGVCRRESVPSADSLAAAALFYGALLFYSSPIASPNSVGLLLFLAAIFVPWACRFSTAGLAMSVVLGILAFFSKQYFIASLGYVALYVFIAESKKRAIYFGLGALTLLALGLALVSSIAPYYLDNTFFGHVSLHELLAAEDPYGLVVTQFKDFTVVYYPLLLILALAGLRWYRTRPPSGTAIPATERGRDSIDLFDLGQPLLAVKPDYILLCCGCSVLIIALVLGKNPGNYLTYLLQLILPFLLAATVRSIAETSPWRWLCRALLMLAMYNSYGLLSTNFYVDESKWRQVRSEIAAADNIYASPLVLQEVLKTGSPVYLNGHTAYFPFGSMKPAFFERRREEDRVAEIWDRYVKNLGESLQRREFDLVLLDNWMTLPVSLSGQGPDLKASLEHNYRQVDQFVLPLMQRPGGGRYRVRVYKPRLDGHQSSD